MKEILQFIFSKKYTDSHKIFTILGLKIKFKDNIKTILNSNSQLTKSINQCKQELSNVLEENSAIKQRIGILNNKFSKDFIMDNIENPKFFDIQQDIYNFYTEWTSKQFYNIFKYRISKTVIFRGIERSKEKLNKKYYILGDIDYLNYLPKDLPIIKIDDIDKIKDDDFMILLIYNNDFEALETVEYLKNKNIEYMSLFMPYPLARYFHTDKNAYKTLEEECSNNSHFCAGDFENIFQAVKNAKKLEGDIVEIGTYKGDSGAALLNYMQKENINKNAYFLDTYEGFTYGEAYKSEDTYWQGTHADTSFEIVKNRFAKYKNAHVVKSNIITDELPTEIDKICMANIDVDMYEAVKAALYKVKDKVVQNGIIICEDYGHTPALLGGQKAVREFLSENPNMFTELYFTSGQMFLIKK